MVPLIVITCKGGRGSFGVHLIANSFIFRLAGKDGLNRDITPMIEDEALHLNSNGFTNV